jgi:hypothetical protein
MNRRIAWRWWLLALAGAPIMMGVIAQALSVRVDSSFLRVSAPNLDFLKEKPLERLKDGNTVGYLAQLTVATGEERTVQGRSIVRFAFSYDIWTERFKVTVVTPGPKNETRPSAKNLTREAAQAWCLDQLKIDVARLPADRPVFVRLEMRSEDARETQGIIGEPGINLSGLIALFSRPVKNEQVRLSEEIGPLNLADLRKPRS